VVTAAFRCLLNQLYEIIGSQLTVKTQPMYKKPRWHPSELVAKVNIQNSVTR